jgi:chemotaxis protein MotB
MIAFRLDSSLQRCGLALLSLSLLVGVSGCVTQGKYDELQQDQDSLTQVNQDLQRQLDEKQTEVDVLEEAMVEEQQEFDETRQTYDMVLAELSVEVAEGAIAVEQMESGVNVRISEDVLFKSGSATVGESGASVVRRLAEELAGVPYQIVVGGYTDDVAIGGKLAERYPTNWDLAGARAASVVAILESAGVPSEQLVAVSFGENDPVASNESEEGRAQNRRIEVRIRPVEFVEDEPAT